MVAPKSPLLAALVINATDLICQTHFNFPVKNNFFLSFLRARVLQHTCNNILLYSNHTFTLCTFKSTHSLSKKSRASRFVMHPNTQDYEIMARKVLSSGKCK